MSNSVWPHRQQPTRLPRPWDSPGKNTGVGCHFLLQCMKMKSESEVAQLCPTPRDPMDCSLPGSSVHGIFQARVLEWGAIAFSSTMSRTKKLIFDKILLVKNFTHISPVFPVMFYFCSIILPRKCIYLLLNLLLSLSSFVFPYLSCPCHFWRVLISYFV